MMRCGCHHVLTIRRTASPSPQGRRPPRIGPGSRPGIPPPAPSPPTLPTPLLRFDARRSPPRIVNRIDEHDYQPPDRPGPAYEEESDAFRRLAATPRSPRGHYAPTRRESSRGRRVRCSPACAERDRNDGSEPRLPPVTVLRVSGRRVDGSTVAAGDRRGRLSPGSDRWRRTTAGVRIPGAPASPAPALWGGPPPHVPPRPTPRYASSSVRLTAMGSYLNSPH